MYLRVAMLRFVLLHPTWLASSCSRRQTPRSAPRTSRSATRTCLAAERSFRDLKGILRLRPIFHRLEERIRAHILICWLALLLIRLTERQTGDTWRNLRRELERLHLVTLAGAAGQVQQTTRLTPERRDILAELQIEPPPRLTSLTPA